MAQVDDLPRPKPKRRRETRGRKPVESAARSVVVAFRLTPDEARELQQGLRKSKHKTNGDFAREAVLGYVRGIVPIAEPAIPADDEVSNELSTEESLNEANDVDPK